MILIELYFTKLVYEKSDISRIRCHKYFLELLTSQSTLMAWSANEALEWIREESAKFTTKHGCINL